MTVSREKKVRRVERESASKESTNKDEVFDSSKYDAMTNMTEGGASLRSGDTYDLADSSNSMEQGQSGEGPATVQNNTGPKITPMMVEERARTLREANEDIKQKPHSSLLQRGSDKFVLCLNIALAAENAAVERLHARIQQCLIPEAREKLIQHLEETREQKSRLASLIQKFGGQPTSERAQLPNYSPPESLAQALESLISPEEQELKSIEVDALIEHAEVITYNMLVQMAERLNVGEALPALRQSLKEEEDMTAWTRAYLPSNFAQLWGSMEKKMSMTHSLA
jgi:ferritin-like metal-binding protein YciE